MILWMPLWLVLRLETHTVYNKLPLSLPLPPSPSQTEIVKQNDKKKQQKPSTKSVCTVHLCIEL